MKLVADAPTPAPTSNSGVLARREQWLRATATVTRRLVDPEGPDPLYALAHYVHDLTAADTTVLAVPTDDGEHVMVEVAVGANADELVGLSYPSGQMLAGLAIRERRVVIHPGEDGGSTQDCELARQMGMESVLAVPLIGHGGVRGALVVGRRPGHGRFHADNLEAVQLFADQAAVALEIADAHEARNRVAILEDRARIAADLHDHVIQRLFATALSLQVAAECDDDMDELPASTAAAISGIQDAILQLRSTIFELRDRSADLRSRILDVVAEIAPLLACSPYTHFGGPVGTLVTDPQLVDDVVAVVRESLTNVAKYAAASAVRVSVTATPSEVIVEVVDDGRGIGDTARRSGIANLAGRAARHGGGFEITNGDGPASRPGTRVLWRARLA